MVVAACLGGACQGPPQEALTPNEEPVAIRRIVAAPAGPDTTGEAVWHWLQEARYRETWTTWPDTAALRPDTLASSDLAPHGALVATYMNPVTLDALERGAHDLPPGAIILVEENLPDSTLSGISVMVHSTGYDPENRDWFFARFGSAGEVEAAGRVEACQGCHVLEPDYLFGAEVGTPLPVDSVGDGMGAGPP